MARQRLERCATCGCTLRPDDSGRWVDENGVSLCDAEFSYDGGGSYPTSLRRATYHHIEGEQQEVWVRPDLRRKEGHGVR